MPGDINIYKFIALRLDTSCDGKLPFLYRQHKIPTCLHSRVTGNQSPEFEPIRKVVVFTTTFLIFTICGEKNSFTPRVTYKPIERAKDGKKARKAKLALAAGRQFGQPLAMGAE